MHDLYVRDILRLCDGRLFCGDWNAVITNICTDSRKVQPGDVYVGIKGDVYDGNSFYRQAFASGASICILEHLEVKETSDEFLGKTIVLVDDSVLCLQELARYKRSLYDIPVIAITGSVGKTSTKDLIYSVVSQKYRTHKTIGNYNNHLGVPLTILGLREEEALVIEMGMNHFREIALLSDIAKPTMVVVTNIGTAHIGNLGSRENILKAKLEILEGMQGDYVIINGDDDLLSKEVTRLAEKYQVQTVSIESKSNYQAIDLEEAVFWSRFSLKDDDVKVEVNVGGRAYIYNSLMAIAVGRVLGIRDEAIKKGIGSFKLSSHRLEKKENSRGTMIIDDTYNANFDSMKASLELLGNVQNKRRVAVLGDMLELGEYTLEFHTKIGEEVVKQKIDLLILVGENSRAIGERARELGYDEERIHYFLKESECYSLLDAVLTSEDIVLVKGSHGIHLDLVVEELMRY